MIQMLDPPGVWGLSRRGLHFLLKNRRNKRNEKKGAFSITRHRNLRGLDLVCINVNFSVKNVILKRRMKTVRGRIDANPDRKEKPKNEKRKILSKASSTLQAVQPAQPVS